LSARSFRRERERQARRASRRRWLQARNLAAAGAIAAGAALLGPSAAGAATFAVDNTSDNGALKACTVAPNDCSLRGAVDAANNTAGADTISLSTVSGTIRLVNGAIAANQDLAIQGPGAAALTISGDANNNGAHDIGIDSPIFEFQGAPSQITASVSGLTLSGGTTSSTGGNELPGGAIYAHDVDLTISNDVVSGNESLSYGGGIDHYHGNLTIDNSTISGNTAYRGGGGVASTTYGYISDKSLTVTDSRIVNNLSLGKDFSPGSQDYAYGEGGGILGRSGHLSISNSTISGNVSQDFTIPPGGPQHYRDGGGGANLQGIDVTVSGSALVGNHGVERGGGLSIYGFDTAAVDRSVISGNQLIGSGFHGVGGGINGRGDLTISDSTVSGNTAAGPVWGAEGGGIYWLFASNGDGLAISNSTISGNQATGGSVGTGRAGGIEADTGYYHNPDAHYSGPVYLDNSTITSNIGGLVGGVLESPRTDPDTATYGISLSSTILAHNTGLDAAVLPGPNNSQGFTAGNSLIERCGQPVTSDPSSSNIFGLDPGLGPLVDNGGPAAGAAGATYPLLTQKPSATSPVVDAGVANSLTADENGNGRTVDAIATNRGGSDGTDMGAVELPAGAGSSAASAASCVVQPPSSGGGNAPVPPATTGAFPTPASSPHGKKKSCKKSGHKSTRSAKKCRKNKR
jgi:hypothetical protein